MIPGIVQSQVNGAALGNGVPTDYLAWWSLDENTGTATADRSGNFDGTLTSSSSWGTAKLGASGFQGDGTNRIDLATASNLFSLSNELTFGCWVYPDAATGGCAVADFGYHSSDVQSDNRGLYFSFQGSQQPRFRVRQNDLTAVDGVRGGWTATNITLDDGEWNLVFMMRDNTNAYAYCYSATSGLQSDSTSYSSSPLSYWSNRRNMLFGVTTNGDDDDFVGAQSDYGFDEPFLYDRLLTESERLAIWNGGTGAVPAS